MQLQVLLEKIGVSAVGADGVEIYGLAVNADSVKKGDLFVCYKGCRYDSHEFAQKAVEKGAAAVVAETPLDLSVPVAIVDDGRRAMTLLSREFYGRADEKLKLVAVTGTNGKTTVSYMLKSIFDKNNAKTGVIGTLGILYGDIFISPELTTPDPIFLHGVFADMVEKGVEIVFMEVSAHALYFDKTEGLTFETAIFTNLTQDHLDFFKTMAEYGRAKAKLFADGKCKRAVINSDDQFGIKLLSIAPNALTYGLNNPADTFAVNLESSLSGSTFVINVNDEIYDVKLKLPALHNVYNALAAATAAHAMGVSVEVIAAGLKALSGVDGRLENVATLHGAKIFVDFAHTPDGLEKSLSALRGLCDGRLICLFGCGGNRDAAKRPIMGEIAAKFSDLVIITSDNPRYEDPYEIISQIEAGVKKVGASYVAVTDRETAIEYALNVLEDGDVLLVAGKGGENYQEIMGVKRSFNDGDVIKNLIG